MSLIFIFPNDMPAYNLYNGENEVGPDSRHVPLSYFILF